MKARFTEQQPPVKIIQMDGIAYVFICLNEEYKTEEYPSMGNGNAKESYYEYDYNEICGPADALPLEDIQSNPEAYLEYAYIREEPGNLEQRVAALEQEREQMNSIFEEVVNNAT